MHTMHIFNNINKNLTKKSDDGRFQQLNKIGRVLHRITGNKGRLVTWLNVVFNKEFGTTFNEDMNKAESTVVGKEKVTALQATINMTVHRIDKNLDSERKHLIMVVDGAKKEAAEAE